MKTFLEKTQQKICAIWGKTKLHISLLVSGKLKKLRDNREERRDILAISKECDWYYQNSWLSKHFWDKLKRNIMNIIYKLYTKLEPYLLSDFLFELEFYTTKSVELDAYNKKFNKCYLGDFKCYLPIVIKAKEISEAQMIAVAIGEGLKTNFGITMIGFNVSDKIITKEKLKHIETTLENKFKGGKVGYINIITFTPKENDDYGESYSTRTDRKSFMVVKSGPMPYRENFEYIINYYKVTTEE